MPTAKKAATIDDLEETIGRAKVAIATDYRGLKMSDLTTLRRRLREVDVELTVVKNTLAVIAAERAGKPNLKDALKGPSAIAFGYGDEVDAAKTLIEFIRTSRLPMTISGGLLGNDRVMTTEDVTSLALLPPKPVVIAQVLGAMQAPIASFVGGLSALVGGFAWALQARIKQLEEGAAGAAPAASPE